MITIKTKDNEMDWHFVREEVFIKEQGFQNEFDDIDDYAIHITLYVDDKIAGCARCFPQGNNRDCWVLGRIAILPQYRHQKLGGVLLKELENEVKKHQGTYCILDAQCRAKAFYECYGYETCGEIHMDEHVPHIQMQKTLNMGKL